MTTNFHKGTAMAKCDVVGCLEIFFFSLKEHGGIDFINGTDDMKKEGWNVYTQRGTWRHVCPGHNLKTNETKS